MAVVKFSIIIFIALISVIYSLPVNELYLNNNENLEEINNVIDYDDLVNNYQPRTMMFAGALPGGMKLPHNHKDVQTSVRHDLNGKKVLVLYRPVQKKTPEMKAAEQDLEELPDLLPEKPEQLIGPNRRAYEERVKYGRLITTPATEEIQYYEPPQFRCPNGQRLTKRGSCREIW